MKTYLLSAAGVIFLSVIVSLLLPEGKLNKTVVFIMRIVCILVLIQPLTSLFDTAKNLPAGVDASLADYGYVSGVYSDNQSAALEELILNEFGEEADCSVTVEHKDGKFTVIGVTVILTENNGETINKIYEYLSNSGYINITVYAQST